MWEVKGGSEAGSEGGWVDWWASRKKGRRDRGCVGEREGAEGGREGAEGGSARRCIGVVGDRGLERNRGAERDA